MSADVQRELDPIADELYALNPDEFTAARDERVKQARSSGDAALAREVAKLRKPTQSAWLINVLWRDQRDVMEQFFEVAEGLRQAQAQAAGGELRELMAQRRQLENAMIRQAKALAQQRGVEIGAATEREAQETLSAALAQPEVADEVRTGRLTKAIAYAGFGTLTPVATSARPAPRPEPATTASGAQIDDFAAKAAERARQRRAEAQGHVDAARAALDQVLATIAEQDRAVSNARKRHHDLTAELEQTEARVRDLKAQVAAADQSAEAAQRRRDQMDKDRQSAQNTLEHAEQTLRELPEP
jgi:hypothetical protein